LPTGGLGDQVGDDGESTFNICAENYILVSTQQLTADSPQAKHFGGCTCITAPKWSIRLFFFTNQDVSSERQISIAHKELTPFTEVLLKDCIGGPQQMSHKLHPILFRVQRLSTPDKSGNLWVINLRRFRGSVMA
jgi:hypothetical protein